MFRIITIDILLLDRERPKILAMTYCHGISRPETQISRENSNYVTKIVETCNTTDSLRKTATSRIESHMRHVICRILTVYDSTQDVAYQGFTTIYLGRGMSHTVAYYWERHFW